jgi:hypothetical protein
LKKSDESEKEKRLVREIQRNISVVTAALLLTGQITIRGTFVTPQAFRLSLGGPLTGTQRLEGRNKNNTATILIDVIDIFIALLLLKGSIVVEGTFIGSREFTLIVSGPIFGMPIPEPSLPDLREDYNLYKKVITKQFNLDQ